MSDRCRSQLFEGVWCFDGINEIPYSELAFVFGQVGIPAATAKGFG